MNVIINQSKLKGTVLVPPSKSLSHRAIIAASLAKGKSVIKNVIYSDDIIATIDAMRACGANITQYDDYLVINGGNVNRVKEVINANESGSTIRFMIPIALTIDEPVIFTGNNHLVNRPLDIYFDLFDSYGIKYEKLSDKYLPIKVYNGLKPGVYNIRGDVSSQFITGLLYALPLLNGDSEIRITTKLESVGYVDLTMDILKKFGIVIKTDDYKIFYIKGNQEFKPFDYTIEGDYSQVAFWLVANTIGADIKFLNMSEDSFQGDKKIIEDINSFKGKCFFENGNIVSLKSETQGCTIDFSQSPDLGPILTVLASLSKGVSRFINVERLRIKECDRVTCMIEELSKLGGILSETENEMVIEGVDSFNGSLDLDSHNDHRIVMALAIASIRCNGPIKIKNALAINKSYPHFFETFKSLGGILSYEE